MSMTLNEILNKFPNWVCETKSNKMMQVHSFSGFPLGWIHQDKTRSIIYESYTYEGNIRALAYVEFLSKFKHRRLLTIKTDLFTRYIHVLQGIK